LHYFYFFQFIKINIKNNTANIDGNTKFIGAELMSSDLRASVALVLAAIVSNGKSYINRIYHLDRGLLEFYLAEGSPLENDMFKNNPDKEYVVFCGVGGQGTLATKTMKDMGVKNVKNITGGMKEWEKIK